MTRKAFASLFVLTILCVSFCTLQLSAETGKTKSFDDVEISYFVKGSGEPALVFVHGWSCDKSYWTNQIGLFSKNYKVVAVDLAGHGDSGLERKDYTIQSFGKDIAAVVNSLELDKVILIGHSMGGPVCIEAAKELGNKVVGIVGADTYQDMGKRPTDEQIEKFLNAFREDFKGTCDPFVRNMFPKDADQTLVNKIINDMCSAPIDVAISAMGNLYRYNDTKKKENFVTPIIAVNAPNYPTNVEGNNKIVESFRVKYMEGPVGHFVMMEKPDEFNKLMQEAIDDLLKN